MKKVTKIKFNKIWGYEDWIYSPIKGKQTYTHDGQPTTKGPLIKIINTYDKLSVQVHPDDKLAKQLENETNGKAECWYVLKSGAPFITGLKTYNIKKIKLLISENKWNSLLKTSVVKEKDFINIPAGQVHGIPENTKVLEIQQPSDITYRFFDYNRYQNGKLRELHINKALMCIKENTWKLKPIAFDPLTYKNDVCTMQFWNKFTITNSKCIVIDINKEQAYIYEKHETIKISNVYLLININ